MNEMFKKAPDDAQWVCNIPYVSPYHIFAPPQKLRLNGKPQAVSLTLDETVLRNQELIGDLEAVCGEGTVYVGDPQYPEATQDDAPHPSAGAMGVYVTLAAFESYQRTLESGD